jgi:hypothetical protein
MLEKYYPLKQIYLLRGLIWSTFCAQVEPTAVISGRIT